MEEEADTLKTETSMLKRDLEEVFIIMFILITTIIMILIIIMIINMINILDQVRNEKSSLELQMEACKAEIKMVDMERPLQQVDDHADYYGEDYHDGDDAGARG